ncbi:cellulose biosynthesis protein BcsN [Rhizobium deserti]|uniref:Cellulose biosynthesis protein BcsN n=1 Tax=Rhizobium deserti TaxID=2547961 RepID=A0A4R5UH27_9HYPH|nr:cellulose biosynthesis protein BcsN [Rhizobium deserti]TDK35142.1 cellulose biosynthesis protein BcsN [Rhizobium deserti]
MADRHYNRTVKEQHRLCRRWMVLALFMPFALAGCAGQPVQMGSTVKSVPVEQALVMPPPAGPGIVSVVERRYDNAIEQEIHLSTSAMTQGQNKLTVQLFGTTSPFKMSSNTLTSTPVTQAGTASEMRRALPGVRMARSLFYVQNSYGPFGYAFGRGAGTDLCIYAWQQVRAPTGTISPFANYGSIQIRLRVCEAGATEQKLLAIMYHFTILGAVDAGGWNPYGEPGPVSPALGGIGAPTYPRPAGMEPMVPAPPQRQSVVVRRPAVVTTSAAPQSSPPLAAALAPEPIGIRVPSPAIAPSDVVRQAVSAVPSPTIPSVSVAPPAGMAAASRVTVPSPSCATQTEGSNSVCR